MNSGSIKPMGAKNYGSIGHLPCSRMGPSDHHVHVGQQKICTVKVRNKKDIIYVTEKVDGSNVGILKKDDKIFALGRAGYLAQTSPFEQHQLFASWVRNNEDFWRNNLRDGQRAVGEWLAQAHGTRYSCPKGPFIMFDLMIGSVRFPFDDMLAMANTLSIPTPQIIHVGGPISVEDAMAKHENHHGFDPEDGPEGVVYRVENEGCFDFMAKWVRPTKVDGKYLPEMTGANPIWNWRPK